MNTIAMLLAVVQPIWPSLERMPEYNDKQIAAMTDVCGNYCNGQPKEGFNPDEYRMPYVDWQPAPTNANGACMILISGGSYMCCCDVGLVKMWNEKLTALGYQCVNFVYRTPRAPGREFYRTAWIDGQRAVRVVRNEAKKYGFDPERIGAIGMSAGGHLTTLLATSALTPAYAPIDELDKLPCHLNAAVANAPAYNTATAGTKGGGIARREDGTLLLDSLTYDPALKFDAKTCPISFHHGGVDPYTPNGSTQCYRQMRKLGVPAELHLFADRPHGPFGFESAVAFLHQLNFDGRLEAEIPQETYNGEYTAQEVKEMLWPEKKMPNPFPCHTNAPYLTWFIPKNLKTKAIQIVFPGGGYMACSGQREGKDVAQYFNKKGMTAVVVWYRTPRPPKPYEKHFSAWQDAQRAIKMVRSEATSRGLDPERIGTLGFSAGGHLTLMSALSSTFNATSWKVDELDPVSCKVQWACPTYPAYVLSDGVDGPNKFKGGPEIEGGVEPWINEEFMFDKNTPPMCFNHGDSDGYSAMGSVKVWEKLRRMGIQSDLHTYAKRGHCFQFKAAEETGSKLWLDRVWDFLTRKGFNK